MISSAKHKFNLEGWPKLARLVGALGLVGLLAANTTACSSTSAGEGEEEVVDEEGGNEAAAVAKKDSEPAAEAGAANEAAPEAAIAGTDTGVNTGMNTAGVDQASNIPPTESAEGSNAVDAAPSDAAVAEAATPAADGTAPAAVAVAPAPAVAGAGLGLPAGTNAVVYVGGEHAAIYDAPNGREVARLAHGDFILASAEGEWAKTRDGRFVRSSDLQVKPVGRKIVQSRWRSPRSGH